MAKAQQEAKELFTRLSKQFEYQKQMLDFIEEHAAVSHQLILNLYQHLGMEFPKRLQDYRFKTKDPRCDSGS